MRKKDILELKRRFKKDDCTFTKVCGCYVNGEKHTILKFRESFLNLDDDEYFKYLEIAKKVLSGTIGNNILELNFPTNEDFINEKQVYLMELKNSKLKDDTLLDNFYKSIIDNYDCTGNFVILIFHDVYDVITKTTDNIKIDESEEVYEYVLCAICPVSLSGPGLGYFKEENKIKARIRDWVVGTPVNGFMFPAFIDRGADANSIMYYTKNPKDPHPELMENALGCYSKQTATIQKERFQSIIKDSFRADEEKADKLFMDIQENLNTMIDEYNSIHDNNIDCEPITLTTKEIQNILIESDVPEDVTKKIEESYVESFGDNLPLADNLIDTKILKANEQRKKEENLQKQVEVLQNRLKEINQETHIDNEVPLSTEMNSDNLVLEEDSETILEDNEVSPNYDVVLQVKPEKIPQIKSQVIDGQKCIIIPVNDDEQTTVNGLDDIV